MSYTVSPTGELDQGDLIRRVTVFRKAPIAVDSSPELVVSHVLVLSHGCEIDKPINPAVGSDSTLVARVVSLSALPENVRENARHNNVLNVFYLPADDGMPQEAVIDWRTVQPVDKRQLLDARPTDRYICTVVGELFEAASERLWEFLFRTRP